MARDTFDLGALEAADIAKSPLYDILSSASGAEAALPEVSPVDVSERGCVLMFYTDGLTKYVSDAEIKAHCAMGRTAEKLAQMLGALALERGGSDNIRIVIAQAPATAPK